MTDAPTTDVMTGVLLGPLGVSGVTPSSFRSIPGPVLPKKVLYRNVPPVAPRKIARPGLPLNAMMLPLPAAPIRIRTDVTGSMKIPSS